MNYRIALDPPLARAMARRELEQRGETQNAIADLARVNELLHRLKVRGMCFELMIAFCDRALEENRLDLAREAYDIACKIHGGPLNPYTFAVATWLRDPDVVFADMKRHISLFIGERSTGIVSVAFSNPHTEEPAKRTCAGCEKDDRREWTEPEEHTCAKHGKP